MRADTVTLNIVEVYEKYAQIPKAEIRWKLITPPSFHFTSINGKFEVLRMLITVLIVYENYTAIHVQMFKSEIESNRNYIRTTILLSLDDLWFADF